METMYLQYFTKSTDFPFFIQYGQHEEDLFMHTHKDFTELTIVLSGNAVHVVNKERFLVKKGDVFIISKDIPHGYENPNDFKICNIMYQFEDLFWSDSDIRKSVGFHALFVIEPYLNRDSKFQSRLKLSLTDFETVGTMIAGMIEEYATRLDGWKTLLHAEFMRLVVLLSRAYQIAPDNTTNIFNLALPISYIENHFSEPITIEELASQANLSVRHFSRLFHNAYNLSPGNYITQLRIQYARVLLKNKCLTISEVAYEAGFSDSNYFTRQFKKLTGYTPGEYQKQKRH